MGTPAYDKWLEEKQKLDEKWKKDKLKVKLALKKQIQELRGELISLGAKKRNLKKGESPFTPTEQQAKLIDLLLDFDNPQNNNPEWLAEQAGIAVRTYYKYRNDPGFMRALDRELTIRRTRMRLEAFRHLFRRVKFGNPKILFKYLEMLGEFKQQIEVTDKRDDPSTMTEGEVDKEIAKLKEQLGESNGRSRRDSVH